MQDFQKWLLDYGGASKLASRLNIHHSTVLVWVRREGYPKVETMCAIVKLSKGKLTLESIVESIKPGKKH